MHIGINHIIKIQYEENLIYCFCCLIGNIFFCPEKRNAAGAQPISKNSSNVLPAMGNELITLLKETSISGYIGLVDLTKGSDIIRSITYEAMMPLGVVACLYLIIVLGLNAGVRKLEKRLRKSER